MTTIEFDAKTHPGKVRDHNEDNIFASAESQLWIVADGMGGHACGEVASEIVVREISRQVPSGHNLVDAIELSHTAVTDEAAINTRAKGMGATVVTMQLQGNQYHIAWVGDSRCYRLRKNKLELLTRDHSYLEWLKDNGITVEEARRHPKRNVITQSIGVGEPNPDMVSGEYLAGDRYLLCSDGLNDELTDEEILAILRGADNSEVVSEQLVKAALDSGGRDNISVILIDIDPASRPKSSFLVQDALAAIYNNEDMKKWLPVVCGVLGAAVAAIVIKLVF